MSRQSLHLPGAVAAALALLCALPATAQVLVRARSTGSLVEAMPRRLVVMPRAGLSEGEVRSLHAEHGAQALRRLPLSGYDIVELPEGRSEAETLDDYLRDPRVASAEFDVVARLARLPDDPLYRYQGHLAQIECPRAWDVSTGSGEVVVAVIDGGVDLDHPDLRASIWRNEGEVANGLDDDGNGYVDDIFGWDFVDADSSVQPTPDGKDQDGADGPDENVSHGTQVAGCVAAIGGNGEGVTGVAWQTRIMVLKVFPDDGGAELARVAEAILYAARNGADIINLSLGGGYNHILDAAIDEAWARGSLVVVAAGNENVDLDEDPQSPVNNDRGENKVVGVAALDASGRKALFSNYGAAVDISAPGTDVLSTSFFDGSDQFSAPYRSGAGTSFASPIVAGVAALIKARQPELTGAALRDRLLQSITDADSLNAAYAGMLGRGLVNARLAVSALAGGSSPPANPTPANGAVGQGAGVTLSWEASTSPGGAVRYDLYLGSAEPPPLVASGLTDASYAATGLLAGHDYRWRVVTLASDGTSVEGPLWGFTAGAADAAEPDGAPGSASEVAPDGALHRRQLTAGDADFAVVRLEAGVTYEFRTVCILPGVALPASAESKQEVAARGVAALDTVLSLYAPDGLQLLAENDDALYGEDPSSRIVWTCPTSGAYYARVIGYRATTSGDYELSVRPLGAAPASTDPTPADPVPADGAVNVATSPVLRCAAQPGVTYDVLFGSDTTLAVRARGLSEPRLGLEGLADGRTCAWQVVAHDAAGRRVEGPVWHFTVGLGDPFEPDGAPPQAKPLRTGADAQVHAFATVGDVDYLRFSAAAGGTYVVSSGPPAGLPAVTPLLEVLSADGATVLASAVGSVTYTATAGGALLVRATSPAGVGFAAISLSGPPRGGLAVTLSPLDQRVALGSALSLEARVRDDLGVPQADVDLTLSLTGPAARGAGTLHLRTDWSGLARARVDSRRFGLGASRAAVRVDGASAAASAGFVTTLAHTLPRPAGKRGMRIVASPVAGTPDGLLGLGGSGGGRLAAYSPASSSYAVFPGAAVAVAPGAGYFLEQSGALTLSGAAGTPADPEAACSLPLAQGWNLIGNPFTIPLLWQLDALAVTRAGVRVGTLREAAAAGLLDAYAWAWDGASDAYRLVFDAAVLPSGKSWLEPYEGAFLRANAEGLALEVPAQTSVVASSRARGAAASAPWLELRVSLARGGERRLYVSVDDSRAVTVAPPPEAPGASACRVSFVDGVTPSLLACLRPGGEARASLRSATDDRATLSFDDLRALPRDRSLVLRDPATGQAWDLRAAPRVTIDLTAGHERALLLECRTLEAGLRVRVTEGASLRGAVQLLGELSRPAVVTLVVENAAGRVVRRGADLALPAGTFELSWDGRDDRGASLPAGRYAVRLTAIGGDGQRATCRTEVMR
jgi:subtilisin family serine protease